MRERAHWGFGQPMYGHGRPFLVWKALYSTSPISSAVPRTIGLRVMLVAFQPAFPRNRLPTCAGDLDQPDHKQTIIPLDAV